MIPHGWSAIPMWRATIVVFKMPTWGFFITWRGADGWSRQIWPKERLK